MRTVNIEELIDIICKRFTAPVSILEVIENETQLINGMPTTYVIRYITKKAESNENFKGEFDIEEIRGELLKIKINGEIILLEQDTEDNVMNFDIG